MKMAAIYIRKFTALMICCSAMSLFSSDAYAAPLKIHVFSEDQSPEMTICRVSDATIKYNVEAAIRYNQQLPVSVNADLKAYININALEMDSTNCAISYSLQFYKLIFDSSLPDGRVRAVTGELCNKGGLMLYSKAKAQSALSDAMRNYVDECIARVLNPL